MCGIFGFVFAEGASLSSAKEINTLLADLFILSQQRGQDASGVAVFELKHPAKILKKNVSPSKLIKSPEFKEIEHFCSNNISQCLGVIGHSRMVTSGDASEDRNNHPLREDGISLIHNGIICNADELLSQTKEVFPVESSVDTEALLALIRWAIKVDKKSFTESVAYAYSKVEGTASICTYSEDDNTLVLATNNGSLYFSYSKDNGAILFASEKYILQSVLTKHSGLSNIFSHIEKLPANTAIALNLQSLACKKMALEYSLGTFPVKKYKFDRNKSIHSIHSENILSYDENLLLSIKRCRKCLLPETHPYIKYDNEGICNYCLYMKPTVVQGRNRDSLHKIVETFISQHPDSDNCLIPISGGRDSCYGANLLVKEFGVKPLTYTYDWGMVTDLARRNVARTCGALGLENILVSANIRRKLDFIRMNVKAWLKKPDLGLIPLFMAGDKHFFYWANKIKRQNDLNLNIWMMNSLENADFKEGFSGVRPNWERDRADFLTPSAKFNLLRYYGTAFLKNPRYINSSLLDSATSFFSFYFEPRVDFYNLFDFIEWDEGQIHDVLYDKLGWENTADSSTSWRVGDGSTPFYNYIYTTVCGFSENDTFRSHQIRNGTITRDEGLKLVLNENIPRREGLIWYLDRIGLPYEETIRVINKIPKLYQL